MKRIIAVLTTAILLFACCITVSATAPSYTAAYSTPTVDGKVNSSEYGAAVPFDKSNTSLFYYNKWDVDPTGANANAPDIDWSFAWNEDALYVGIVATNIENIFDGKFQIDLIPDENTNKKYDGKKGIFYTFSVISLGTDGLFSIARDNYQTAGNTSKTTMNITRNEGVAIIATEQSAGIYHIEVKLPLAELQVVGVFSGSAKLALKEDTWSLGCYFIGNDGGYTSSQGAGKNSNGLYQCYNDLKLLSKDGGNNDNKTSSTGSTTDNTSSKDGNANTSSKNDDANNNAGTNNTSSKNNTGTNTNNNNANTDSKTNTGTNTNTNTGTDTKNEANTSDTASSDGTASADGNASDIGSDVDASVDTDNDTDTDTNTDAADEDKDTTDVDADGSDNTVFIVVIVIAAVIVLGAAGAAIFIIMKNKKVSAGADEE